MKIILASKSKFRGRALDLLGLKYETIPSNFDEKLIIEKDPLIRAKILAEKKAQCINKNNSIIIAADLFTVCNNKVYEKPNSMEEAFQMIKDISQNSVRIIGGIALFNSNTKKMLSTTEEYTVNFRKIENHEIKKYISKYPVLSMAAAFEGDALLMWGDTVSGKYPFLCGLPIQPLIKFLRINDVRV